MKMASELDTALKNMASSLVKYVQDASVMQVETRYVEMGAAGAPDFEKAKPAARTVIRLDGDSETVLPVRQNEAGVMEVDSTIFELHQQNVNTVIEYRARILNALIGLVQTRRPAG
jgi:hypothetical protein